MNEYRTPLDIKTELSARTEELRSLPPTVVKIGGSIVAERETTLRDVAFLSQLGIPLVIVHGGGPEIDEVLKTRNIPTERVDGLRVTDAVTLDVVVSVLNGINAQVTHALQELGVPTIGYTAETRLLQADIEDKRLGFVGSVSSVPATGIRNLFIDISQGIIPVISPVGIMQDHADQYLNINGDTASAAITAALGGNLILVTNVEGVLDQNGLLIPEVNQAQYQIMRDAKVIDGGMIPKLQAGIKATSGGGKAIICHGNNLLYAFSQNPRGTIIT